MRSTRERVVLEHFADGVAFSMFLGFLEDTAEEKQDDEDKHDNCNDDDDVGTGGTTFLVGPDESEPG